MSRVWLSHLSYLLVGIISLLIAVFVASKIVRPSHSQENLNEGVVESSTADNGELSSGAGELPPGLTEATPQPSSSPPPSPAASGTAVQATGSVSTVGSGSVAFLEPYIFDMREGRRNPFRAPTIVDSSNLSAVLAPGTPMERYDLDELKLVGIMWDVRSPRAMFVDPQGEVHMLGKDDRIGRKRGYVAAIREGEVVVVESATFEGENTFSTRVLKIEK